MIRALLPVTFALTLAVAAGILLAQNGVLSGSNSALPSLSAASSGGSCCGASGSTVMPASLAGAESACCSKEFDCSEGGCPSQATFTSFNVAGGESACSPSGCPAGGCSADGCPFTAASADTKCCSGEATPCGDESGKPCCKDADECSEKDGEACCTKGAESTKDVEAKMEVEVVPESSDVAAVVEE